MRPSSLRTSSSNPTTCSSKYSSEYSSEYTQQVSCTSALPAYYLAYHLTYYLTTSLPIARLVEAQHLRSSECGHSRYSYGISMVLGWPHDLQPRGGNGNYSHLPVVRVVVCSAIVSIATCSSDAAPRARRTSAGSSHAPR